jgi:hypothetical protein
MNTIEKILIETYGALLSIAQLARVLDRSPEGLRISLRTSSDWTMSFNSARIKIGRRVYFKTTEIAQILSGNTK